jgi:hypothetical protein
MYLQIVAAIGQCDNEPQHEKRPNRLERLPKKDPSLRCGESGRGKDIEHAVACSFIAISVGGSVCVGR